MNPFVIYKPIFNKNNNQEPIFLMPDENVYIHEHFCNCETIEKRAAICVPFWTRLAFVKNQNPIELPVEASSSGYARWLFSWQVPSIHLCNKLSLVMTFEPLDKDGFAGYKRALQFSCQAFTTCQMGAC